MKEWLVLITEYAVVAIDFLALAVILFATFEAFIAAMGMLKGPDEQRQRRIWLRYARWLVAALTFQLAADIVETSVSTDWVAIGRIAAIAVIRTFLNYFLDRDVTSSESRSESA